MKTCDICGRSIKTGKKYCWEHRHTAQAEGIKGEKLIKEATISYKRYKLGEFWVFIHNKIEIPIFVGLFILGFIFLYNYNLFSLLMTLGIIWAIFCFIMFVISKGKLKPIEDEIKNRNPQYTDWVKEWVQRVREEKEYKKSLLR